MYKPLMSERERLARARKCGECRKRTAKDFCGAWIEAAQRECHKPLCRDCAAIHKNNLWLCKRHKARLERLEADIEARMRAAGSKFKDDDD